MDLKTGRIYAPEETKNLPEKTLKELEPLTREEAAVLADVDPTERAAALERMRLAAQVEKVAASMDDDGSGQQSG